jgi:hypothetical protein
MVEDADADDIAHFAETAGDLQVLLRWRRVAARVVVDEDDRGGGVAHDLAEDVARRCVLSPSAIRHGVYASGTPGATVEWTEAAVRSAESCRQRAAHFSTGRNGASAW